MEELVRTNDIVLISFIESLLGEHEIDYMVVDHHMSIVEGSLGVIPRRILVIAEQNQRARKLLCDAGIADELTEKIHDTRINQCSKPE